jgi:hypothetical protein
MLSINLNPKDLLARMADMIDGIGGKGRFLRTTNTRMKVNMNLVMKDLTTTTMTTVGNGYLDLMKEPERGRSVSPLSDSEG